MIRIFRSLALGCLLSTISTLAAQEIVSIHQVISLKEDGSAINTMKITARFEDSTDVLIIPSEYSDQQVINAQIDGMVGGISVSSLEDRMSPVYQIRFPEKLVREHDFTVTSNIPDFIAWEEAGPEEFGTYNWQVGYSNILPIDIGTFSLKIILPKGWNFHRITSSEPPFRKKDPQPPYRFKREEGLFTVTIKQNKLSYLDRIELEFAFKHASKSNLIIWIGILIAALYMFAFKGLLKKVQSSVSADSNNHKELK